MHTCFLHTWKPLVVLWRCCWSFTISRSLQQSFLSSSQLGYGLVKRLVGLGVIELDHPALQCFLFCIFILFEVLGECNLLLTDCTRHLTGYKYSCILITPPTPLLLFFLPVDDFAGFFSWSWHNRHRRAPAWQYFAYETLFLELATSNLPNYLLNLFNMPINLSLHTCLLLCLIDDCKY